MLKPEPKKSSQFAVLSLREGGTVTLGYTLLIQPGSAW